MANEELVDEPVTFIDTSPFCEDMSLFYANETFADVGLIVKEKRFYAHRVVLVTRCKFFKTALMNDPNKTELIIDDVSIEVFRNILKYIYTGMFSCSKQFIFDTLMVAHRYSLTDLEEVISEKMISIVNKSNICDILNNANEYDITKLRDVCHDFIDDNLPKFLKSDALNGLTQKSMVKLLERHAFNIPEIEIFNIASKWCSVNTDVDKQVISCVRLSLISKDDILNVVWSSKLIDSDTLFSTFAIVTEQTSTEPEVPVKARLIREENLATLKYGVRAITGKNAGTFFNETKDVINWISHSVDGMSDITISLSMPSRFNHIKMKLGNDDKSFYRYYVEISLNQKNWKRIIDYSNYDCRSYQHLYFEEQTARYIRIVGTYSSNEKDFCFSNFKVYFENSIPKIQNQIVCSLSNVIKANMGAYLIEGTSKTYVRDSNVLYSHKLGDEAIVFHLGQPYIVSSIIFKLFVSGEYKYFIETSINKKDWQLAVDRRDVFCSNWQILSFEERPAVYIKIVGTSSSVGPMLSLSDLVCLKSEKRTGLERLKSLIDGKK